AGLVVAACTDLSTKVEDAIGEDVSGGSTPPISDPAAALTGVYNQLRTMRGVTNTSALMEHTTDEMMGPTRGTDWSDFGVWRQLPNLTSGADAGTASQEAVDFLLARLYLNRAVYTTSTPASPSAGPYTFASADMDTVIVRVQAIIDNPYTDLSPFWDNFHWDNTIRSKELVFVKAEAVGTR